MHSVNGVQGHRLSAGGMHGIHRDAHVDGVAHQQRNPATVKTQFPKLPAETGHTTQVFPVIEPFLSQRQRLLLRSLRGRIHQRVNHGGKQAGQGLSVLCHRQSTRMTTAMALSPAAQP